MKNKLSFAVFTTVVLAIGIVAVGCASAPKESPVALESNGPSITPKLDELLHKYMVVVPSWENMKDGMPDRHYTFDPIHFEDFRSELEEGREFVQIYHWLDGKPGEQGEFYADWWERYSDDRFQLILVNGVNPSIRYGYEKVPQASRQRLDQILLKYTTPQEQTWDGEGKAPTYVYSLDPARFEAFKAELDAGGEYAQTDTWTEKRDWERDKTFAQWAVRPNGEFDLRLCKADNSVLGYRYEKK
ncbi:hypothetical protein AGMMS49942_17720 [Spirochaetia bacterium]|nr:hypothetical protein AGMMS49942_17720 [Spirochaetia bacterium]